MGIVMGVTAAVLAIAAGIVGLILWTALMFPSSTARARRCLETRPGRCFCTGVAVTLLLGAPSLRLLQASHGLVKMAGWGLALCLAVGLIAGLTGMAELLGDRLRALSPGLTPLGALVRGAVTIELAAIIPFLGWFLFAPLVSLTVIGAATQGSLRPTKDADQPLRLRGHRADGDVEAGGESEVEDMVRVPVPSSLLCALCASVVVPFLR